MRTEILCISVLRVASGPRVKLVSCKSALNPEWFTLLTVLRRWSGVSLTLFCVVVYSTRRFVCCLTLCYFVLVFFSPFSIAITSLGEERANLSAFRTFVRFVLIWFYRFPLPLGAWEGLRFVIVAFPGLFSYPFLNYDNSIISFSYVLSCRFFKEVSLEPRKSKKINAYSKFDFIYFFFYFYFFFHEQYCDVHTHHENIPI